MSDILRELAEPSRRAILNQLKAGPRNVSELVGATGMKQPNVSNHLSKLRARGIVRANKIGREVYYALSTAEVEAAVRGLLDSSLDETEPDIRVEDATRQYAKAAVNGDEATCTRIIDNLVRQGVPLVRIYHHVIAASMELVGKWYTVEAIDEGQEHLASAITERMMARVLHFSTPTRKTSRTALLGCVSGNWHSIGLRMISDHLRLTGWRTLYLGANVPLASFITSVREHEPEMVLISCARAENEDDCLQLIHALRDLPGLRRFRIGVGGAHVASDPTPFTRAGADFCATNLMQFAEEVMPRMDPRPDAGGSTMPTDLNGENHTNAV